MLIMPLIRFIVNKIGKFPYLNHSYGNENASDNAVFMLLCQSLRSAKCGSRKVIGKSVNLVFTTR